MKNIHLYLSLCLLFGISYSLHSQEIKIFTTEDFDLIDSVKTNVVVTKYGKESYEFNPDGRLVKSTTKYNDADYSITYYKYDADYLVEKRFENYRDNVFDVNTSIANFYAIDSVPNLKITERVVDYNKQLLEQYEYAYNDKNLLDNIVKTTDNGIDKTVITYQSYKGENTKTYTKNGEIVKSIRTSTVKEKDTVLKKVVLTKTYLKGKPVSAKEAVYSKQQQLLSVTTFIQDAESNEFNVQELKVYTYDEKNIVQKTETTIGEDTLIHTYIYQFDNGDSGNWVKQIITPDNTYTTREITYY